MKVVPATNQQNLFDYGALPRGVEVEARAAAAEIKALIRRTAEDITASDSCSSA